VWLQEEEQQASLARDEENRRRIEVALLDFSLSDDDDEILY